MIKKECGFTIFYMGINLGVCTIVCAYLGKLWDEWIWSSGIGMVLGLLAFRIGSKNLENVGYLKTRIFLENKRFGIRLNI